MKMFGLTEADRDALRQDRADDAHRSRNDPGNTAPAQDDLSAPDVYFALSPSGGIPAAVGAKPGSAVCRVQFRYTVTGDLEAVPGLDLTVYNATPAVVPGSSYIVTLRNKHGDWVVVTAAVGPGSGGIGTRSPVTEFVCLNNTLYAIHVGADGRVTSVVRAAGCCVSPGTAGVGTGTFAVHHHNISFQIVGSILGQSISDSCWSTLGFGVGTGGGSPPAFDLYCLAFQGSASGCDSWALVTAAANISVMQCGCVWTVSATFSDGSVYNGFVADPSCGFVPQVPVSDAATTGVSWVAHLGASCVVSARYWCVTSGGTNSAACGTNGTNFCLAESSLTPVPSGPGAAVGWTSGRFSCSGTVASGSYATQAACIAGCPGTTCSVSFTCCLGTLPCTATLQLKSSGAGSGPTIALAWDGVTWSNLSVSTLGCDITEAFFEVDCTGGLSGVIELFAGTSLVFADSFNVASGANCSALFPASGTKNALSGSCAGLALDWRVSFP